MNALQLAPNEQVIAIFRKHPFFIWMTGLKYIVLALLPAVMSGFVGQILPIASLAMPLYFAFLIILWLMFFIEWTDFILDTWILTDDRLVNVEQIALFNRRVSTLSIDRIQDVTIAQSGLLDSFLGIGMLLIQTAGEEDEFKIVGIKDPTGVKELIMETYQQSKDHMFDKITTMR